MSNDKLAATFGPFKVGDRVEVDDLDRLSMVAILGILQDHADGATTKGEALKAVRKIVTKKWGGVIDHNN